MNSIAQQIEFVSLTLIKGKINNVVPTYIERIAISILARFYEDDHKPAIRPSLAANYSVIVLFRLKGANSCLVNEVSVYIISNNSALFTFVKLMHIGGIPVMISSRGSWYS